MALRRPKAADLPVEFTGEGQMLEHGLPVTLAALTALFSLISAEDSTLSHQSSNTLSCIQDRNLTTCSA